ncbi:MAG: GNAT family N-acetyltransferase [Planctomycetes bacterium]|nr:GNAT family N-acetyltransferase [Planctomycetota bacterium]
MKVELYQPHMAAEWDRLCDASDHAWLMHRRAFHDAVNLAWNEPERRLVLVDSGRIVGILPLQYRAWDGSLRSSGRAHTGPALAPGLQGESANRGISLLVQAAIRAALALRARKLVIGEAVLARTLADTRLAMGNKASCREQATRVVSLRGGWAEVEAGFSTLARRRIRKAAKEGVRVERLAPTALPDLYYPLHLETYARTGETPHPQRLFQHIWKEMAGPGLCRVFGAWRGQRLVAALNVAAYKQRGWYWTGASTAEGQDYGANYALQCHAMRELAEEGFEEYEVGELFPPGAAEKLRGLTAFKSRFGGEDRSFRIWERPVGTLRRVVRALLRSLSAPWKGSP